MADIWVISDTHFNHAKILDFKDYIGKPARSFDNVDQMNEAMMDNWASVVKPKDTVIHCGDVLFGADKVDWMTANFAKLPESHRFGDGSLLNVHGHIHSNPSPEGPYKCVCVEQINYTPVNIEDLL